MISFHLQLSFASGVLSVAKSAASVLWNHFVKEREIFEENTNIQTASSDLCISLQRLVLTLNNSRFIYFLKLLIYTYKSPLPLTLMSDQERNSPNNNDTISSRQVMRIKKNVSEGLLFDPITNSLN